MSPNKQFCLHFFQNNFNMIKVTKNFEFIRPFCSQNINKSENDLKIVKEQVSKPRKQFLVPTLTQSKFKTISNVVGLHLAPNGISWAKLTRGNVLQNWGTEGLTQLPKRSLPVDVYPYVRSMVDKIPEGDVYIFEVPESTLSPLNPKPASLNLNSQQLILSSMLVALLNNRIIISESSVESPNNIYYLKSKLPAKLFGLLIGTEKVSNISLVSSILDNSVNSKNFIPPSVDKNFQKLYGTSSTNDKELLGYSLMIAVCFLNICIHKNNESINAVSKTKR